jgi:hypothetical protein
MYVGILTAVFVVKCFTRLWTSQRSRRVLCLNLLKGRTFRFVSSAETLWIRVRHTARDKTKASQVLSYV